MNVNMMFAKEIVSAQYEMGLTQREMARRLDVSLAQYKRIIEGNTKVSLELYAKAVKVTGNVFPDIIGMDETDMKLLTEIDTLDSGQRERVENVIRLEKEYKREYGLMMVQIGR